MNRRLYMGFVSFISCAAISFLSACGGSSNNGSGGNNTPVIAITANAGYNASETVGQSFGTFSATVTSNGAPASGVSVTFTAPSSGASGTFATSPAAATDTETTNSSGVATSQVFTANSTSGAYTVTASTSGAATPASFSLTNNAVAVSSSTYVFYMSGLEQPSTANGSLESYYALAGAVTIDSSGNVLGGVQDYNDGSGITSPSSGDTISAVNGALVVDSVGQGTLTLTTNNTNVGIGGVETFAIQFVNTNHALITQFDGTATSSGSLDLQTAAQTTPSGGFAFTLSGVDWASYAPVAYAGVFNVSSGSFSGGDVDYNDNGTVAQGGVLSGSFSAPGSYGRGSITGVTVAGIPLALNYYIVGPEAIRIIDVDDDSSTTATGNAAIGSAFGQGAGNFSTGSLNGSFVFGIAGNPWVFGAAALGEFTTDGNGNILSGLADDNEVINGVEVLGSVLPASTYTMNSAGFGSLLTSNLGDVTTMGIYMTDPNLNLNDPNNTATGSAVGGALLLELDSILPGTTGLVTPQTDSTTASFSGNYIFGWQNFNAFANGSNLNEFDMVGQGTMTSGALSITGSDSDPFGSLTGTAGESQGDTFSGTPLADSPVDGRYTLLESNSTPNPLSADINGATGSLEFTIYQANGGQLYWLGVDTVDNPPLIVSFGPIEQQGSLATPAVKKPAAKHPAQQKGQTGRSFRGQLN